MPGDCGAGMPGDCGAGSILASTSATVGRLAGSRFKHCRAISANVAGRAAGKEGVSDYCRATREGAE